MSYSNELHENTPAPKAGPVQTAERFLCLDALRGVAVLGILVMNIYAFAMPFSAYANPLIMGGTEAHNLGTWVFTHIVADQKFYSIFSMLFGAGLILMMERAEKRGARFGPIYYRRTLWLMLIGLLHAYFLWFGDILFHYALMGMLIFLFRKAQAKTLIITSLVLMLVPILINYGSSFYIESLQEEAMELEQRVSLEDELDDEQQQILKAWKQLRPFVAPTPEMLQEDVDAFKGSYADAFKQRMPTVLFMHLQLTFSMIIWRIGGLMLLGMALMKMRIISGERDNAFYKRLAIIGYGLGLPMAVFSAFDLFAHDFDSIHLFRTGNIANYVGAVFVAFGHIAAVMLVVKTGVLSALVSRFAAVGRMALTNYLMHSLVMTTIFYGYGFGLYGDVPRFWQQGFVIGLISIQLLISPWWLSRFRFGPVEWLWRSLTYWERQPMRQ